MSRLRADPPALADIGAVYAGVAARLEEVPVGVRVLSARLGDAELAALAQRLDDVVDRVGALATVVRLVAGDLARTESGVASSFVASFVAGRAVPAMLAGLAPEAVQALLVGVARGGSAGRRRTRLARGRLGGGGAGRDPAVRGAADRASCARPLRSCRGWATVSAGCWRCCIRGWSPGSRRRRVEDRFAANRVLVSAEMARLRDRLVAADRAARSWGERRLAWYAEMLSHRLLAFDPSGDGRVAEVFGDLATARHLAVYVPGTGTSIDRYPGNAERASSFVAGATDLAVVLWQNADFPDQPLDQLVPPISLWDKPIDAVQDQLRGHVLAAAYRDAADRPVRSWLMTWRGCGWRSRGRPPT